MSINKVLMFSAGVAFFSLVGAHAYAAPRSSETGFVVQQRDVLDAAYAVVAENAGANQRSDVDGNNELARGNDTDGNNEANDPNDVDGNSEANDPNDTDGNG